MSDTRVFQVQRAGRGFQKATKGPGLQTKMTMSYVWMTVLLVLLLEVLVIILLAFGIATVLTPYVYKLTASHTAEDYAYATALQAHETKLNPDVTFQDNQPGSIVLPGRQSGLDTFVIPYTTIPSPEGSRTSFVLLFGPDARVIASSYPERYPIHTSATTLFPENPSLIPAALVGNSTSGEGSGAAGKMSYAVETVWGRNREALGAIYVQIAGPPTFGSLLQTHASVIPGLLISTMLLLAITLPVGGLFGFITTSGLVRRIHGLARATTHVADGLYSSRVQVTCRDELGQLEHQFNRMAQQLAESIDRQQKLVEQNARLAERTRIARELHDSITQELFSLRMLGGGLRGAIAIGSDLQVYVETLEEATTRMIREMRALLLELRPSQLEQLGFVAALEELAATYRERLGIKVLTSISNTPLDARTEHALLRLAQEALSNAARHADASEISLSLASQESGIEFTVTDNGKGFAPSEDKSPHGLGLRLMQERVQELHGDFSLSSEPGQGTRLHIHLPREKQT